MVGGEGGWVVGWVGRAWGGGFEWEQWRTYKQKAEESHYLKVIRKSPKGQWWTCNAEGIM